MANLCNICSEKSFIHYLQRVNCLWKCHTKCMGMNVDDVAYPDPWYCPPCMQDICVYNQYDDGSFYTAAIEGLLDCSYYYHEINIKLFMPFEINEGSDTASVKLTRIFNFTLIAIISVRLSATTSLKTLFGQIHKACIFGQKLIHVLS